MFPKKIWTFWNSSKPSPTVDNCIKTWRFLNPDYEINMINMDNVEQWAPGVKNLRHAGESMARFSDYVRLSILARHGGIWLDASTICIQSFDAWFASLGKPYEFVGFYNKDFTRRNKKFPVIESWAFACVKDSDFVRRWRDEFLSTNKFEEIDDYLEYTHKKLTVDFQNIDKYDDSNYLAIHISAQKVLQYDKYPQDRMLLLNAEDGPLKYRLYKKGRLSVQKRVERLCKDYNFWASSPIIKFTGTDREVLEKHRKIRQCVFNNFKIKIMTVLTGIE